MATTSSPTVGRLPALYETSAGTILCVFCGELARSNRRRVRAVPRKRLSYNRKATCAECGDKLIRGRWRNREGEDR
jgi:hypothetical protein